MTILGNYGGVAQGGLAQESSRVLDQIPQMVPFEVLTHHLKKWETFVSYWTIVIHLGVVGLYF
jgi:hypothetical protein